jgi:hypothetical protein
MKENYAGFRITDLWVFVGIDDDGDEGVMAMASPAMGGAIPLIAADDVRRTELEPIARDIAKMKGGTYECRHFVRATDE